MSTTFVRDGQTDLLGRFVVHEYDPPMPVFGLRAEQKPKCIVSGFGHHFVRIENTGSELVQGRVVVSFGEAEGYVQGEKREEFVESRPVDDRPGLPSVSLRSIEEGSAAEGDLELHPGESVTVRLETVLRGSGIERFSPTDAKVRVRGVTVRENVWGWEKPRPARPSESRALQDLMRGQSDKIAALEQQLRSQELNAVVEQSRHVRRGTLLLILGLAGGTALGHFGLVSWILAQASGSLWVVLSLALALGVSGVGGSALATALTEEGPRAIRRRWVQLVFTATLVSCFYLAWQMVSSAPVAPNGVPPVTKGK